MTKLAFLFMLIFIVPGICFGEDLTESDFSDLFQISSGNGSGQLAFSGLSSSQERGTIPPVKDFYYRPDLGWVINSESSQKTFVADDQFRFKNSTAYIWQDYPFQLYFDPKGLSLYSDNDAGVVIANPVTRQEAYKQLEIDQPLSQFYFSQYDYFFVSGKRDIHAILNLRSKDVETNPLLSGEDLLRSSQYKTVAERGFQWEQNNLRFRGFLVTKSLTDFLKITNWNSSKIHTESGRFDVEKNLQMFSSSGSSATFRAYDSRGNSYWSDDTRFFVFNREGALINVTVVPIPSVWYEFIDRYAVHPSGDIYRIVAKGDRKQPIRVQVYRNTWDPEARVLWERTKISPQFITPLSTGVFVFPFGEWMPATLRINTDLRDSAKSDASSIAKLTKDQPVTILSNPTESSPWYQVLTWDGVQGWVAGDALITKKL